MTLAADMRCRLAVGLGLLAGCHALAQSETTRAISTERIVHAEGAIAHRATLALTDAGRLRFVEPLECPTEEVVHQHATIEVAIRPNLATFTVGVIAAAAGGVMLTTGLFSHEPSGNPYTYLGLAGIAAGLPLAIGPWLGDRVELRDGGDPGVVRRPGPSQPCGERPMVARSATLDVGGLEIRGAVDSEGVFAIAPYQWTDAYRAASAPPSEITAVVDAAGGPRTVAAVLDPRWLAAHAADFLAHADFDGEIQPLRVVPGIAAGALGVRLVNGADGAAVHVVLPLRNAGPGDAWAVRGQINAPGAPAIDGRMLYVGKLARGAAVSRELVIPVSARAAGALRGQTVELSVELRDGHDTAPSTPVRFRGVLAEAPAAAAAAAQGSRRRAR
jgi:hypothetical protein